MAVDHFKIVTIQIAPGQILNVTSTRQVAELLTGSWPPQARGEAYNAAVETCMDHFEGKKSGDNVRSAFIEAAKDARIFLWEGTNGGWVEK